MSDPECACLTVLSGTHRARLDLRARLDPRSKDGLGTPGLMHCRPSSAAALLLSEGVASEAGLLSRLPLAIKPQVADLEGAEIDRHAAGVACPCGQLGDRGRPGEVKLFL